MESTSPNDPADQVEEHIRGLLHARPDGATSEELRAHADLTAASREAMRLLDLLPSGRRWSHWRQVAGELARRTA